MPYHNIINLDCIYEQTPQIKLNQDIRTVPGLAGVRRLPVRLRCHRKLLRPACDDVHRGPWIRRRILQRHHVDEASQDLGRHDRSVVSCATGRVTACSLASRTQAKGTPGTA